jgi:hypothetical protein
MVGLAGLFLFFLTTSWRKWIDPMIDFGRELYLPWRISHGAVLYRDVDDIYGPLSKYFNAALFSLFGPGFIVLVIANLLIFLVILAATYPLLRRAWGIGAALAAMALFITVFGFSQLDPHGNYNYAAPYAHETTHGLLVCVILAGVLVRWIEDDNTPRSFLVGLLFGCTWILKPEIALAGGLLIFAAAWVRFRTGSQPRVPACLAVAAGIILPTAIFFFYFAHFMPWGEALSAAARGWLNAITTTRYSDYSLELEFLGLDQPWHNFWREIRATFAACLVLGFIALAGKIADPIKPRWRYLAAVGFSTIIMVALATRAITWLDSGRALPGLSLIYLTVCLAPTFTGKFPTTDRTAWSTRLLLAVLAVAMLARMFLHGRLDQYGYYQAVIAAIIMPAILIGELPAQLRLGQRGTAAIIVATLALFLPGAVSLAAKSQRTLSHKTEPVASGRDLFYTSQFDPTGTLIDAVSSALRQAPRDQTVLALPDGPMINYLARLPSPIAPYCYFAMMTENGKEQLIVHALQQHPPDYVVITTRPLFEFGVAVYGRRVGEGKLLLDWVEANYQLDFRRGGNPLDYRQRGATVLIRKPDAP